MGRGGWGGGWDVGYIFMGVFLDGLFVVLLSIFITPATVAL